MTEFKVVKDFIGLGEVLVSKGEVLYLKNDYLYDEEGNKICHFNSRNALDNCVEIKESKVETVVENKETAMEKLQKLPGLETVKKQVEELISFVKIAKLRDKFNLKNDLQSLHMMFKGNPGTGKTTVARLLGEILREIGVLSIGHVVEVNRGDLVSPYQGVFEKNVKELVEEAKGGILFIDEIYSLFSQNNNDQTHTGISVLLAEIENHTTEFICIGAGYSDEVDTFINSNPGLLSRFPIHLDFENYSNEQLVDIAELMFSEKDYNMSPAFVEKLKETVKKEREDEHFGNARVIRNIVESSIREQAFRLILLETDLTKEQLMEITEDDFKYKTIKLNPKKSDKDKDEFFERFAEIAGF